MAKINGKQILTAGVYSYPADLPFESDGSPSLIVVPGDQNGAPTIEWRYDNQRIIAQVHGSADELTGIFSGSDGGLSWRCILQVRLTVGQQSGRNYHIRYTVFEV